MDFSTICSSKSTRGENANDTPTIKCLDSYGFESIDNLMAHYQSLDAKDIQPNLPKFVKKDGQWKELLPEMKRH